MISIVDLQTLATAAKTIGIVLVLVPIGIGVLVALAKDRS